MSEPLEFERLDKWLWAARFFKTRPLAIEAINGGKVHLNGQRTKPGKDVKVGSRITIHKDSLEWEVTVLGLSAQRRPAKEAVLLYEEAEQSLARRTALQEQMRLERAFAPQRDPGRPDKHDRRDIRRLSGKEE